MVEVVVRIKFNSFDDLERDLIQIGLAGFEESEIEQAISQIFLHEYLHKIFTELYPNSLDDPIYPKQEYWIDLLSDMLRDLGVPMPYLSNDGVIALDEED